MGNWRAIVSKVDQQSTYNHQKKPTKKNLETSSVYGLANAIRYWYIRMTEESIKLNVGVSTIDPSILYWKKNVLLVY